MLHNYVQKRAMTIHQVIMLLKASHLRIKAYFVVSPTKNRDCAVNTLLHLAFMDSTYYGQGTL